jgi:hypothetical protein
MPDNLRLMPIHPEVPSLNAQVRRDCNLLAGPHPEQRAIISDPQNHASANFGPGPTFPRLRSNPLDQPQLAGYGLWFPPAPRHVLQHKAAADLLPASKVPSWVFAVRSPEADFARKLLILVIDPAQAGLIA